MKVLATLARFKICFAFVAVSAMCIFFAVAVTAAPGDLDTSFDGDGLVTTDFNGNDFAHGVAIQADGKIIAVGEDGTTDFAIARYNTDGSLDTSFDGDGKVTTDFSGNDVAFGVAIQSDGKIVAVGRNGSQNFALARYNTDGSLDTSFDGDGRVTTNISGGDVAFAVAIQSDGKIVVAGKDGTADFALARYNTDGSLDTSFDGDGIVTTNFNGTADTAYGVAIQADGKIVAVGQNSTPVFALARYNADGSLDTSFDGDGSVTTNFSGDDLALSVAIQSDGKIVAVGRDGSQDFALARYNTDGSLDTSFDGDGKVTTSFTAGDDLAFAVAIQSDGKIVAAGTDSSQDFALARYNTDGSLDTSFGTGGGVTTSFTVGDDEARGVAIQADGKIVAVGRDSTSDFALARYTANTPPVSDAGPDQSVSVGDTVTLDGNGSTDADGDPLTYAWSFDSVPAGSTATLSDPTAVMPTFVADEVGTYTVQLIVNDLSEDSAPDTVTITSTNTPPVANAGPDQSVSVNDTVTLDGSGSNDAELDPLTYAWSFVSVPAGSTATLSDPTAVMPTFVADEAGTYEVQLIVNDGLDDSAPDTVTITATQPSSSSGGGGGGGGCSMSKPEGHINTWQVIFVGIFALGLLAWGERRRR